MTMVVVADVLRTVFDGGESVAMLGPSVAAVLTERAADLAQRAAQARQLLAEQLVMDPAMRDARRPEMRTYRLPSTYSSALALVAQVTRL